MLAEADIAVPASLIGDRTRASLLLSLVENEALPATELARRAGVGNSAASIQLGKLVSAGLVQVERHGRHRYFRLSDADVALALEALAVIAPTRPARAPREAKRLDGLRAARTCYDHLAGSLGVSLFEALCRERILARRDGNVELTPAGRKRLAELGVDMTPSRRPPARLCLDWSERRYHLAGALGVAMTDRLFELGWIERTGTSRAVRVTRKGRGGLRSLGVEP
jgi:DNA-binding transcriptional ArsR family regulator